MFIHDDATRSYSQDTVFEETEKTSLSYTLQKESLKIREDEGQRRADVAERNAALFGAVCSLQDSPYRIFKVN